MLIFTAAIKDSLIHSRIMKGRKPVNITFRTINKYFICWRRRSWFSFYQQCTKCKFQITLGTNIAITCESEEFALSTKGDTTWILLFGLERNTINALSVNTGWVYTIHWPRYAAMSYNIPEIMCGIQKEDILADILVEAEKRGNPIGCVEWLYFVLHAEVYMFLWYK